MNLLLLQREFFYPVASIFCYYGNYALPQILDYMKEAGLTYYWTFAVKLQGSFARVWTKDISVKWKPLLGHIKGETKFDTTQHISDFIDSSRPDKILHEWEKVLAKQNVIDRRTVENQTVLDLIMATGTTG